MTDPIKDALRAACETDGFWSWDARTDRDILRDRAAAVAAFLRALPDEINGNVAMFTPAELAAAVEKAARDE